MSPWDCFQLLPASSKTVLFLRNVVLDVAGDIGHLDTRHLIFDKCWWANTSPGDLLDRFHHLETLVLFDIGDSNLVSLITALPTTIWHVHILEHDSKINEGRPNAPHVLPHLDSFTYTLISRESEPQTRADDGPDREALAKVQQVVEAIIDAPQCTFKYVQSTRSPEDAMADALAALQLGV